MKTLSRLLALTSVTLLTAFIPATQAAPLSPAGDWDFVMTGKQRGVALITFDPSFTLFGAEILRPAPPANPSSTSTANARNSGSDATRDGSSTTTNNNSSTTSTNFYGGATLDGFWTYDSNGRLVGAFNEIYQTLETVTSLQTNVVDGSNIISSITALYYVSHTNGISFRGAVGSGGKLTINAFTPRGTATFKGVRMATLPDYSGNYYGVATKDRTFVEFFTIAANGLASSGYNVDNGVGAGYLFDGSMLVSKQKQVAILTLTADGALAVVTGPYKSNRYTGPNAITGDLRGTDGTRRNFPYKLSPRP